MIRLISTDMDGTLLDEHSCIPPETFELIDKLRAANIRFVVSSGRRYNFLQTLWGNYASSIDFIASNGNQVVCDGHILLNITYDHDLLHQLKALCDRMEHAHLVVHDGVRRYVVDANWQLPPVSPSEDVGIEINVGEVPDVSIVKALVIIDEPRELSDTLYALNIEMGDKLAFLPYGDTCIDTTLRGISKASGLKMIGEKLGILPSEMIAYGDSMNDYEMLRYVGHSCVMENACCVLRSFADHILGSNVEHAVQQDLVRILQELV